MHRPTVAVLGLLQCMAIFACQLKSEDVSRSRRSIIGVPLFVGNRFGQRMVVGYDGQLRPMFEETADDDHGCCCRGYCSSQSSTVQPPTGPEKLRSVVNNDAWWLAVIENTNRNNKQERQEMETKEEWRKYQCVVSCGQ